MANDSNLPEIESKNLTYLEDMMAYEALTCKKCMQYEQMLIDPAQKELARQLAKHHRDHFDALFGYLQNHS
jgi:hypothetical protein